MNTLNELSQAEKKQRILVLCNENEIAYLQAQGLPVSCEDSLLSMQHLKMARLEAERRHQLNEGLQVFTITPEPVQATEAERSLIYAMLVRCRKVISCRDKLEDMLKFDDRGAGQLISRSMKIKCSMRIRLHGVTQKSILIILLITSKSTIKTKAIF